MAEPTGWSGRDGGRSFWQASPTSRPSVWLSFGQATHPPNTPCSPPLRFHDLANLRFSILASCYAPLVPAKTPHLRHTKKAPSRCLAQSKRAARRSGRRCTKDRSRDPPTWLLISEVRLTETSQDKVSRALNCLPLHNS